MNYNIHLVTLAEGLKMDSMLMANLQNSAFTQVREKVAQLELDGMGQDQVVQLLGQLAAQHLAFYNALSQELSVKTLTLRKKLAEANKIKDRNDKLAAKEAGESVAYTKPRKNTPASKEHPNRANLKKDSMYTSRERECLKLLLMLSEKLEAIEEIGKPICINKNVDFLNLVEKYNKYGKKGL